MSRKNSSSPPAPVRTLVGMPMAAIMDSLSHLTPREAAIVGASTSEVLLEVAIKSRLSDKPTGVVQRAFEAGGPLNTFDQRIGIAHLFSIIPSGLRSDLQQVKDIRNKFAHNFEPYTFDTEECGIAGMCRGLKLPENFDQISRDAIELKGLTPSGEDGGERKGIILTDSAGFIGAQAFGDEEDISTLRGRFLTTIRFAWVILAAISDNDLLVPTVL